MPIAADVRILWHLARGLSGPGTHGARLQRFYGPQAEHYDDFRERLLQGRRDLIERLRVPAGARVIELGGGTARNLDFFGERLAELGAAEVVDLCPALLAVGRRRFAGRPNVRIVEADAIDYRPAAPADCVYFSYSLSMIPAWRRALDNALAMLRPGGTLGVVDFYVSAAQPAPELVRHSALARCAWPLWFRRDGVHLSAEHLPCLRASTDELYLAERRARVPYLPGFTVPYYVFVGRKRDEAPSAGG